MLDEIKLSNILFLDVETVPLVYDYANLPKEIKHLWDNKFNYLSNDSPESYYKKAGIYAEFSKVICVSVAYFNNEELRVKSFYGDSEKELLTSFSLLLKKYFNRKDHLLCAHNGKEFDFPFLCRRMLINDIKLPKILNISGKKPWEINHIDTMEMWKFGDFKNYTSLNLLTTIFGISSSKSDIDGSDVARVYWQEKDLKRIVTYCQNDVVAVAQLLLRFKGLPLLNEKNILYT